MVLALARPEVHEVFPGLWKGTAEIALGGLTPRAAERLVRSALGDSLAADTIAHMIERADGNAFYLEELSRRVAESGSDTLPETVLALVQTRLERLEPEARRVVRAASVLGEVFWQGAVAALLGGPSEPRDVDAWLRLLVEREVFSAVRESRFPGEREYRFRHGLLREAAYAMLTDADRTKGHALAGEWLQAVGEKDALVMADHFERGGERSLALPWLVQAAEAAGEGLNFDATLKIADRGHACDAKDTDRGRLLLAETNAFGVMGDWILVAERGREALGLLPIGSARWCNAVGQVCIAGNFVGDPNITASMLQILLGTSVQPETTGSYGLAVYCVCTGLCVMGQFELARSFLERAEGAGESASEPDPIFVLRVRLTRGWVDVLSGQIAKGLSTLLQVRTLGERAGDRLGQENASSLSAFAFCQLGD